MEDIEILKHACREAYQYAWNIEQETTDASVLLRVREIKRVTMAALQATNAEFQAKQAENTAPRTEGGHDGT